MPKTWRAFRNLVAAIAGISLTIRIFSLVTEYRGDSAASIQEVESALQGYIQSADAFRVGLLPNVESVTRGDRYCVSIQTIPGIVEPTLRLEKGANNLVNWENRRRAEALIALEIRRYNQSHTRMPSDSELRPYTPTRNDWEIFDRRAREQEIAKTVAARDWRRDSVVSLIARSLGAGAIGGAVGWSVGWVSVTLLVMLWQFALDRLHELRAALRAPE